MHERAASSRPGSRSPVRAQPEPPRARPSATLTACQRSSAPPCSRPAAWIVFGYFVLGAIMNLISRSPKERAVMTPLSVVLAVLALLVAR
ncbi:hypothetical protein EDF60_2052 [Leucobacter luti]|nr:hypothetical protein EDF60_2052 [Leucobacter luti]